MTAYLDNLYFEWLYSQISPVKQKNPARTYWGLFRELFAKEFVWLIPNDDNRVNDGKDLRLEFLRVNDIYHRDEGWLDQGCSMLELFIGLSRRLAFQTSDDPAVWFWELLENLKIRQYNDQAHLATDDIEKILDRVIWRTYRQSGLGGLFPLQRPKKDQRDVELWYQLSAYLLERS